MRIYAFKLPKVLGNVCRFFISLFGSKDTPQKGA